MFRLFLVLTILILLFYFAFKLKQYFSEEKDNAKKLEQKDEDLNE